MLVLTHVDESQDSTVLAYVMKTLNERHHYGLELFLLSIDEGITGYRDDSLEVSTQRSWPAQEKVTLALDGEAESAAVRHAVEDSFI